MLSKLLVLFIGVPLLELALLMEIGKHVGVITTVALVVLTGGIGAFLARQQGLATLGKVHLSVQRGQLPTEELMDGMLILVAGALLLTPGLITDAVGFCLLIPSLRERIKVHLKSKFQSLMSEPGVYDVPFREDP